MKRRALLKTGLAMAGSVLATGRSGARESNSATARSEFHLKYAPHFGMFKSAAGGDLIDQLKFAADRGFTAWEDSGMKGRSPELQKKIAAAMQSLDMEMGVFVATATFRDVTFARRQDDTWDVVLKEVQESIQVAKRVHARWMTVVPGRYDEGLAWDYQTANCIELLKRCCDLLEPHGLVMVLEPWNGWADHPGCFLHKVPQAYQICKAVGSPSCKILFDLYHQQITEGNLISHIDRAWSEIAYFQCGDNPGRKEPGTGEIHYRNVFSHIHAKGYDGIMGMEHGNSQPGESGEQAVIDAYRAADDF